MANEENKEPECNKESYCIACGETTKYVCIQCTTSVCNHCSTFEQDEESKGWAAGKAVGYCLDCTIIISANVKYGDENQDENKEPNGQNNASQSATNSKRNINAAPTVSKQGGTSCPDLSTQENEDGKSSPKVKTKREKRKPGRKAMWSTDTVNDLVDIVTSDEYYQRKLIFTNTKNQNNGVIYGKILHKLQERANEGGEIIAFDIQQLRTKFKRCISDCKQAAMKIKTATGIHRFQDEKGYGKWFDMLFPLVKTRDSCQPDLAVEPSAIHDISEEEDMAKTFEDFVPVKKIKLTKKNNVAEAVQLFKKVVEQDPAKDLITFMREEAEKELDLVELMLKHNNSNQVNVNPPHGQPATLPTAVQGNNTWNPQYISFQCADNPMYNIPAMNQAPHFFNPPDTSMYGNCFSGQSSGTNFQN